LCETRRRKKSVFGREAKDCHGLRDWSGSFDVEILMLSQKEELKRQIGIGGRSVAVDHRSFSSSYALCELSVCQGMCCYDGVYLESTEVTVIESLIQDERDRFEGLGISWGESPFQVGSRKDGSSRTRTSLQPYDYQEEARLPKDFQSTACVFRCQDGRCSLQQISVDMREDPWHYKPMGCWMHPLELHVGPNPKLSVSGGGTSQFSARTQCGRECSAGKTGYQVFRRELEVLSEILGQDLFDSM
jgi:hypothetical protein